MNKVKLNALGDNFYYEKLENGLEVFLIPMKDKLNTSAMYATRYGGHDINFTIKGKEYKTPTGIAHFLEHKMFERKEDPFKFFGKYGTDVNASTSGDYTGYYFTGNKCILRSVKYLLNWLKKLEITEELVEKEKGIILQEANMYKDNPDRVIYNKIKENVFVNSPNKYQIIGTDEDIKRITKEELELCFNTFYNPNNMFLILAGNFDKNKTINLIKEETKDQVKGGVPQKKEVEEPDKVAKEYEEIKMNVKVPKAAVAYKINKNRFKDLNLTKFELDMYLHFLINVGLGTTSKTREEFVKDNLFIDSFYRIFDINSHYILEFYATTSNPDECIKKLEKEIKDLKLDKNAIDRERKLWVAGEVFEADNPMSAIYSILDDLLDYGKFIPNKIEYVNKINENKIKEVKKCLDFSHKAIIKIIPND